MSSDPWIGQQLGAYQILDLIGRGGMGAVYRALHPALERYAAIKFLRADRVVDRAADAARDERFLQEARAIARLRHPHVVQLYDFGAYAGGYYMILEYVPGQSLYDRLANITPARLPLEDTLRVFDQVASALIYVHRQGMVHRDIKPGNILLNPDGEAILTDFGIVRFITADRPHETDTVVGTPTYIAPEQAQGRAADHRADLYSLAVVLYELLAGRPPFVGDSAVAVLLKHLQEPPPPLRAFNASVTPTLEAVVLKALAKAPEDRYPNVAVFQTAFHEALGGSASIVTDQLDLPEAAPPASALTPLSTTSRLPLLSAQVFGRRTEINALKHQLTHPPVLTTVLGLGGLGKTTLALAVAHELAAENACPDGIFWVDGRKHTRLGAVLAEFADLLKLDLGQQTADHQQRAIAFHLHQRRALLVLDNSETVEDLHDTLEFLNSLPIAVLVTGRHRPAIGQVLELAPLPLAAAIELLKTTAGLETLDDSARALCEHDLEGHPLAIEVVGALVSAGLEAHEIRQFLRQTPLDVLNEKTGSGERSVAEALQLSYTRLSPLAQALLNRVSIFPTDFDLAALAALSPEQSRLHQVKALRELFERSLVTQVNRQTYRLHSLTRQFAYSQLDDPARYHRRASAHYLTEAGHDTLAAAEQWTLAGAWAEAAALAPTHVVEWIAEGRASRALQHLQNFSEAQLSPALWLGILEARGDVAALLGEREAAHVALTAALTRAEAPLTLARLQRKLGELARRQNPAEAEALFTQALAHLNGVEDLEAARIYIRLNGALQQQGEYDRAIHAARTGLSLAERFHAPLEMVEAHINLGNALSIQSQTAAASGHYETALRVLIEAHLHQPFLEAVIYSNLGALSHDQGEWTHAIAQHEHSRALREQMGNADGIATTCFNLGHLYTLLGEFVLAEKNLERCQGIWEAAEADYGVAATHMNWGLLRLWQERWAEAERALQTSETKFIAIEAQDFLPEVYRLQSELALAQDQPAQALALAQRSLQLAQAMETRMDEGIARRVVGEALAATGDLAAAFTEFEASLGMLAALGNRYEVARVQAAWGTLALTHATDKASALTHLRQAQATFTQLGARRDSARTQAALVHAEALNLPSTLD